MLDLANQHMASLKREGGRTNSATWRLILRAFRSGVVVFLGIVLWLALTKTHLVGPLVLPPLDLVAHKTWELLRSGDLAASITASVVRVLSGYLVAVVVAVPLGLAMGWWNWIERLFSPFLAVIRSIPPVAWIPIAILWFGIGNAPAIYIVALSAFPAPLLSSWSGVRNIDKVYVSAARTLGARPRSLFFFRHIVVPAALPEIVTGLRIALGYAWTAIVAAELIAARSGLGYMMVWGGLNLQPERIFIAMLLIGAIGFSLDRLLQLAESRLLEWQRGIKVGR